jgi:SAM-dependent methyltransferase
VNNSTSVDFGVTAQDYARHRAGFPDSLFERLAAFGIGKAGQRLVDLGTGTGTFARGCARRGCQVVGIDPAKPMLDQACLLDAAEGLNIEYRVARAEDTGLPSQSADVVSAGQCWHWFDRPRAAREVAHLLRTDGTLVIAHFDWIPLTGNVVQATEALIELHNPAWTWGGRTGLHPLCLRDLGDAGFRRIETFSYDLEVPYTHEAWRGRIRASAGVAASMPDEKVRTFDAALRQLLDRDFPAEVLQIPHRVFAAVGRAPAAI